MKCEKANELILSDSTGDGLDEHISACESCRNLREIWTNLKNIRLEELAPSRTIDFKIKGEAATHIDRKRHQGRVILRKFVVFAAAACFVMATWIAIGIIGIGPAETVQKSENYHGIWNKLEMDRELLVLSTELEIEIQNISPRKKESKSEFELEFDAIDILT